MSPQGTWLSKPTGLQPWNPEACSERKMALKERVSTHSSQDPAQKRNCLKGAQVLCEESPSTNIKVLAKEAGICWDTLWGWKLLSPIFELSLHCTSEHQCLLEGNFYPCLVSWVLWLPPRGIPLECVALKARGLVFLGLWNYDIWRDGSWQTTTPRVPDNRLRHIPQSFQERAYMLVWELWPEGQDSRLARVEEPMEGLSGNSRGWRMQLLPSPAGRHLPEPCLVPQFLQLLSGDTPTSLVMVARGADVCRFWRTVTSGEKSSDTLRAQQEVETKELSLSMKQAYKLMAAAWGAGF